MAQIERVTVGIVGAGISGLTLAKMLELLGIPYVLWEARSGITEAPGAGVGLMPNGLRILDQLGLFEEVNKFDSPHHSWEYRDADGTVYQTLTAMKVFKKELGYEMTFMERRELLELIYQSIQDKSRIVFSKRVSNVSTFDTFATISATDGSQVRCDFVAGADGVRSVVRDAIVRETLNYQVPLKYLESNYSCVYGVSNALPQIVPGRAISVYRDDISIIVFSGSEGKLIWFLFIDLKCPIPLEQGKRYSTQDLEEVYEQISDVAITTDVKFADIYDNKKAAVMAVLEEGIAENWNAGRLFLLGDAAHKMLPHNAMGASQALESAACFVNQLRELRKPVATTPALESGISLEDARVCLEKYAHKRKARTMTALKIANMACQCLLKKGPMSKAHLTNLVSITNEQFIRPKLLDLSLAEKLEDWLWDSDRVKLYTRQAYMMNRDTEVSL